MKTVLTISAAALLTTAFSSPCFALQENELVSQQRAKELGVTLRSHLNGESGVKVWIEFQPKGELEEFSRVELRIQAGKKCVVDAPLETSRSADKVAAAFSSDPEFLKQSTVTIIVPAELGRVGYQFRVKDFVNLEKYRDVLPVK